MIKQVYKNGDKCVVNFTKTHVGHQNEINRIFLTRSERRAIASKLAEEVPFDAVLDDIRKEISSSSRLERMHMLTKQDLFNIKASLNRHSTTASDQNETILIVYDKDEDEAESEIFYELMDTSSTVLKETLTERKKEMLNKLYVTVNNINTEAEWEALEKLVNPIESALAAVRQQSVINSYTVKEFASTNKHTKQRRLFSPKKKSSFNQAKRRS
ncbi:hypothetical protein JTB14_010676 [Gonioctena quinquepunctata]|nr:hypothetical protein JTB14_010676 [Gonioctena quinquepunctata]